MFTYTANKRLIKINVPAIALIYLLIILLYLLLISGFILQLFIVVLGFGFVGPPPLSGNDDWFYFDFDFVFVFIFDFAFRFKRVSTLVYPELA